MNTAKTGNDQQDYSDAILVVKNSGAIYFPVMGVIIFLLAWALYREEKSKSSTDKPPMVVFLFHV